YRRVEGGSQTAGAKVRRREGNDAAEISQCAIVWMNTALPGKVYRPYEFSGFFVPQGGAAGGFDEAFEGIRQALTLKGPVLAAGEIGGGEPAAQCRAFLSVPLRRCDRRTMDPGCRRGPMAVYSSVRIG